MEEDNKKLTKEEIQNLVDEIREWLEEELPEARRDDSKILRFLEGCKYRIEMTKTKLKNDYNFRKKTPEWYENQDPEEKDIKEVLGCGVVFLPDNSRDEKGRRIIIGRPNFHDASLPVDIYWKVLNMCLYEAMEDDHSTARDGTILVVDLDRSTFTHCVKKMMVLKKVIHWWLGCLPMRIKELHFINAPSVAIYFLDIVKSCLKEKIRNRFIMHKKVDDLKKHIDPKYLPEEYGGSAGPVEEIVKDYVKKISGKRDRFLNGEY